MRDIKALEAVSRPELNKVDRVKGLRVLVCGGRDYADKAYLWSILDGMGPPEVGAIISGMARGADSFAAEWAERFGFPLYKFPADWKKHGKAAGPIRNQQMLDEGKPDIVLAFPGGSGTADMVRRAKLAGIKVTLLQTELNKEDR